MTPFQDFLLDDHAMILVRELNDAFDLLTSLRQSKDMFHTEYAYFSEAVEACREIQRYGLAFVEHYVLLKTNLDTPLVRNLEAHLLITIHDDNWIRYLIREMRLGRTQHQEVQLMRQLADALQACDIVTGRAQLGGGTK